MKVEITVPSLAIVDTIIGGVQGGIRYWGKVVAFRVRKNDVSTSSAADELLMVCDVIERASGERFSLQGKWQVALRLMAELYPHKFFELIMGRADCTTGDVLIQLAAFGEVRYG
ncbi:MAG: hypothetical protein ACTHU0_24900 [Kofleriaceae bacterium]